MTSARTWLILTLFLLLTLPLMPLQWVLLRTSPRNFARRLPRAYHRMVCRLFGIRVHVEGLLPQQGPLLLLSNHTSWIDILVLSAFAPVAFIAKSEVRDWPLFGLLARLQRTVFVERTQRQKTGQSRDEISTRLDTGDILVLFAEGTTSDGASILPFKSALLGAAETSGALVQPITLAYRGHWGAPMSRRNRPFYAWYGDMALPDHLLGVLGQGPIEVTIVCHAPRTVADAGGRKALARSVEEELRTSLAMQLSGAVSPLAKIR